MLKQISIIVTGHDLRKDSPGIGPNSWGYWRILIPYQRDFFTAGYDHDIAYTVGGQEEDKDIADFNFYTECFAKSKNNLQKIFSSLYYIGVSEAGRTYFTYQNKNKICIQEQR